MPAAALFPPGGDPPSREASEDEQNPKGPHAKTDPLGDTFVYSYDEENQLIKAVKNGTHTEDLTYDANGMRVRRTAGGAVTDYFFDGVNLLYEVTGNVGKNHVWANGTLLCTVEANEYTYYHTDHLGTSKLQTDGEGKVISIDITKPYGPVAREGAMADDFSDFSQIDLERSRFQYDAATDTILPLKRGRDMPKQVTDNHEVTVEKTNYQRVKNIRVVQTASDQANTELKIEFDFIGKARLTVKKAGEVVFQDEYRGTELKSKKILVEVGYQKNQAYTVVLELAARNASTPARNTIFSVSWGEAEADYGFVRSLPQTFQTDVYSVKLSFAGVGVTFYLNTGGKLWQRIEPGKENILDQPGRTLTIRAYLTLDAGTNLQNYDLEINPYHDMSFTGKFLEPAIGLVYFGGRWYDAEIGRWITVDPVGDGGNWQEYCENDPVNLIDPDGFSVLADIWNFLLGFSKDYDIYQKEYTIIQKILPNSKYVRRDRRVTGDWTKSIKAVVVHWTSVPGQTAQETWNYFKGNVSREVYSSSHYIIGQDGEIIQAVSDQQASFASGGKNITPFAKKNFYENGIMRIHDWTISIEVNPKDKSGHYSKKAYTSQVRLVADLMKTYHLNPSTGLFRHFDFTGKDCPQLFYKDLNAWETFKRDVEKAMRRWK